jgi:hypothetical protein
MDQNRSSSRWVERRKDHRRTLASPCWVDAGAGKQPIECRISDISKIGAKLTCKTFDQLPDEFSLYLTRDGNVGRRCKTVRRDDDGIGLEFVGNAAKPKWGDAAKHKAEDVVEP